LENTALRDWQHLHARVSRGEPLSPSERETYDAILNEWDAEEVEQYRSSIQRTRDEIAILEDENRRLHEQYEALKSQITSIEKALTDRTESAARR
jgi:chromosome segregation ATPase